MSENGKIMLTAVARKLFLLWKKQILPEAPIFLWQIP